MASVCGESSGSTSSTRATHCFSLASCYSYSSKFASVVALAATGQKSRHSPALSAAANLVAYR